jgi:hypothetical protein
VRTSRTERGGCRPNELPIQEFTVQNFDPGFDGQQATELTALLVEQLLMDVEPLVDLQQRSNDLGRLAFRSVRFI